MANHHDKVQGNVFECHFNFISQELCFAVTSNLVSFDPTYSRLAFLSTLQSQSLPSSYMVTSHNNYPRAYVKSMHHQLG